VDEERGGETPQLSVVASVRCLECGAVYAKPSGGGTVRENPGCPECGYVGWVSSVPDDVSAEWTPSRSAEGRRRSRSG
jgi:predicted  nucleic acid-binding Zn-ribbon protein